MNAYLQPKAQNAMIDALHQEERCSTYEADVCEMTQITQSSPYHSTKVGAILPYIAQATEMSSGEMGLRLSTICQMAHAAVEVSSMKVKKWIQISRQGDCLSFFLPAKSSAQVNRRSHCLGLGGFQAHLWLLL